MDGILEGTVTLTESRLTVGPNARVKADLQVRDLIVFGVVRWQHQRDGGGWSFGRAHRSMATWVAARLSIEENATIKGRVELTGQSAKTPGE